MIHPDLINNKLEVSKMAEFFDLDIDSIGAENSNLDNVFKLKPGESVVRLMPPWRKGGTFYKPYFMHFNVNELKNYGLEVDGWFREACISERVVVDDTTTRTVIDTCPICRLANKALALSKQTGDVSLAELSKQIRKKQQYMANIVDVNNIDAGVQVLEYGKKIQDALRIIFQKKNNITHPVTGRNVSITRKEIPGQRWFDYSVMIDDVSDFSKHWDKVHGSLKNLDNYPVYSTKETLETKLAGVMLDPRALQGYTPAAAPQADASGANDPDIEAFLNS